MGDPGSAVLITVFAGLKDKVVVCTGAASGIGRAMMDGFARHGSRLVLMDLDMPRLEKAKAEILAQYPGLDILCLTGSVADDVAMADAFQAIEKQFGKVDVLLNNAGISMNKPSLELSASDWRRAIDIDLSGVFYCCQAAAKIMSRTGGGVILNTASMYGIVAAPERAAYCASKAGVVALTKSLAVEWAQYNIRVNAVCPGYVRTALVDGLIKRGALDEQILSSRTPMGRLGTPEEIAEVALYLSSDASAFVTGHALLSDGGWTANGYL